MLHCSLTTFFINSDPYLSSAPVSRLFQLHSNQQRLQALHHKCIEITLGGLSFRKQTILILKPGHRVAEQPNAQ